MISITLYEPIREGHYNQSGESIHLVWCGAGVELRIKDDSDRTGLFVRNSLATIPEVLTRDVGWPGEESIGSGTVN